MAKVISTKELGDVLTSPANAHTIERGDLIVFGTSAVCEIRDNSWNSRDPYAVTLQLKDLCGGLFRLRFGINEPVKRIVGSRAGGQLN